MLAHPPLALPPPAFPAATNLQYEIDRALQQVLDRVGEAQAAAGSGAPGVVAFDGCGGGGNPLPPLDIYRPVRV